MNMQFSPRQVYDFLYSKKKNPLWSPITSFPCSQIQLSQLPLFPTDQVQEQDRWKGFINDIGNMLLVCASTYMCSQIWICILAAKQIEYFFLSEFMKSSRSE